MGSADERDGMQRFHQRPTPSDDGGQFISEVVDARLYLSGWIVMPVLALFAGINGPRVDSPIVFAALVVAGFWGVLTVKYLLRGERSKGVRTDRETFREALEIVGADASRWGFLWYVSIACVVAGLALYWIRFVLA